MKGKVEQENALNLTIRVHCNRNNMSFTFLTRRKKTNTGYQYVLICNMHIVSYALYITFKSLLS